MEGIAFDLFNQQLGSVEARPRSVDLLWLDLQPIDFLELECRWTVGVIKSMPTDEAPSPDGFSLTFYQTCWDSISKEVVDALNGLFLGRDSGLRHLNEALIVLLPKKEEAISMRDFRPISLVHNFGKIFSKLLAARLGPRMVELVGVNQSALIHGMSILDNFMLVQGTLCTLHCHKAPAIWSKPFLRPCPSTS
jgi:hypothetical protein